MSYEKQTWVTGDTITADKLNHIEDGIANAGGGDCGYSCEEVQTVLTEETVTTSGSAPHIAADLSYSTPIDAASLIVTFEGADYELNKVDLGWGIAYGDCSSSPDFTNYPIAILSASGVNTIFTETAGTHNIKIAANIETITTSDCFEKATKLFGLKNVADAENNGVLANDVKVNIVGEYAFAEGQSTTASGDYSHAEGQGTTASGGYSHAEGQRTLASGGYSHAEGQDTIASGDYSHAEGEAAIASGESSHAEGSTTASGDYSHAEGVNATASGGYSHAEGAATTASGDYSHAEGGGTVASGESSHAEGKDTTASGRCSHAEGANTTANHRCQHVFGENNVVDPSTAGSSARGTYVEIVGNGINRNSPSNARTLDWNGNESLQGSLTLGNGSADEITITATQLKALLALLS